MIMKKMETPMLEIVSFKVEDVIATSGIPANYFKFLGLGTDVNAPNGTPILIQNSSGSDVTANFYTSDTKGARRYTGSLIGAGQTNPVALDTIENTNTKAQNEAIGIYDGIYESNGADTFQYRSGN